MARRYWALERTLRLSFSAIKQKILFKLFWKVLEGRDVITETLISSSLKHEIPCDVTDIDITEKSIQSP